MSIENRAPVESTAPAGTLEELIESLTKLAAAAGRHPSTIYIDEPIGLVLWKKTLSDGSTVFDLSAHLQK